MAGHHRGQVEADQHDDRAGDRGRQDAVDPVGAGEVDDEADDGEREAADHDRAGDVGRVAALCPDGGDAGHERRAGAEVAGHLVGADQQEHDRADAREHDRQVGVQPHHQREHERRPEHGHDVLGAEPDRLAPREALMGCYRLTGAGSTTSHLNIDDIAGPFPLGRSADQSPEHPQRSEGHHTPSTAKSAEGTPVTLAGHARPSCGGGGVVPCDSVVDTPSGRLKRTGLSRNALNRRSRGRGGRRRRRGGGGGRRRAGRAAARAWRPGSAWCCSGRTGGARPPPR